METDVIPVQVMQHRWINPWATGIDVCSVVTPTSLRWVARDVLEAAGYPHQFGGEPTHTDGLAEHAKATTWTPEFIAELLSINLTDRFTGLARWIKAQSDSITAAGLDNWARLATPTHLETDPETGLLISSPLLFTVSDAARILDNDPAIETGQTRLFDFMLRAGWLVRKGKNYRPTPEPIRFEWLTTVRRHIATSDEPYPQVLVTIGGLRKLHERMGGEAPLNLSRPVKQVHLEN